MHFIDWSITLVPVVSVIFLAAGLVVGRYMISARHLMAGLSVITLMALVEAKYQVGYALTFGSN